jgi:hypothetical protein
MRGRLYHFFIGGRSFHEEFRKQMRLFITFTLGFTIAFTWRQTLFDISQSFVRLITHIENSSTSSILTSVFITIISVAILIITASLLNKGRF